MDSLKSSFEFLIESTTSSNDMKLTIEVNDRGSTVIDVSVENGKVIVTSSSILSDDNERCEIEISELRKFISVEAIASLIKAIDKLNETFEFEDKTCSIY